jgi:hypothetical protein
MSPTASSIPMASGLIACCADSEHVQPIKTAAVAAAMRETSMSFPPGQK